MCPGKAPRVSFVPTYDEGDPLGFVYTRGLHSYGRPEFLCVDVPTEEFHNGETVQEIFSALVGERVRAGHGIDHGYKFGISGRWFVALAVDDEADRARLVEQMGCADLHTRVILIRPLFDEGEGNVGARAKLKHSGRDKKEGAGIVGWAEPQLFAPDGRKYLRGGIISKWREQRDNGGFSTFLDGNKDNSSASNMASIGLLQALRNHPATVSDWNADLTMGEMQYVEKHMDHMLLYAEAEMIGIDYEKAGKYIKTVARNLAEAPQRYKAGVKVAGPATNAKGEGASQD